MSRGLCQNVKPSDVLGQTPQASALGKFLTIPVGYYTGIPETNIPIFTIKTSELTVPISLSYHGGGIKVEEVASNVGLGWSLIGGGAIIQQVNGLPDQKGYMKNDMAERTKNFIHLSKAEQMEFCILTESLTSLDTEPDIFYYTFNGESGKFFFDTDGKTIITIPLSKNQISFDSETSSWEIVSTDGTIYRYSAVEVARTIVQESPSNNFSTNWYVSEIISPNKVDRISFNYYTEYTEHTLLNSEVAYRAIGLPQICVVDNGSTQYSYVKSESRVLSSIQFPGGLVKFIRDTVEREDLKGSRAIKSIEVYDNTVKLIKKAALDYSYGGSTVAKRLFLDKVRFINQSLPNNEENTLFTIYLRSFLVELIMVSIFGDITMG